MPVAWNHEIIRSNRIVLTNIKRKIKTLFIVNRAKAAQRFAGFPEKTGASNKWRVNSYG
jgi:hypothetical protein